MANWQDDYEEGQRSSGLRGAIGGIAWSQLSWAYSYSTLHMIREGGRSGYYVPWTRVVEGSKSRIARFGVNRGWWSEAGLGARLGATNQAYQEAFEQMGSRAASSYISRLATREATADLVASAWMRTGSIRAAERYAAKYAGVMGARASTAAGARFLAGRIAGFAIPGLNVLMGLEFGTMAVTGLWGVLSKKFGRVNLLELGGYFPETQGALTSRQRAVQAITSSQMQARSAIGNEAMLFHR